MLHDLKIVSPYIFLNKFADDTTLLVPEASPVDLASEFASILKWSSDNCMLINMSKTKEIVFSRPSPYHSILPDPLMDIERVASCKLLGVTLQKDIRFNEYSKQILTTCSQRLYLLRALKSKGLSPPLLNNVCIAIVISKICYAISIWGGSYF